MRRLRSPGTIGPWAIVLGLLLAVAPLASSPCSRAAGPQSTAPDAVVMTTVTPGAQWACSEAVPTMTVRAVAPERPGASFEGSLGNGTSETAAHQVPPVPSDTSQRAPRLPRSPKLDRLRPVVLQI
jgi:hypothetical protein